ncbi:hypothetical protein C1752_03986 [Acaryochloris thomasi RCC1774]|uniref:HTH cro/C1-type domain-containing protein n=1 Tax=Acaryochloris thomasi RCC1774 TaxID=1764569 RepID=A0A2W1JE84_9CYAN|nr:nucleotide exchange factor GrpE [Acaryochloris thomasi]PZD72103.1 hypothetical protein C1752_03986 [Acaryochloris thomasi RCC1774]
MRSSDYTERLYQLMQQVNLTSFSALYQSTGLPRSQIRRLRQGKIQTLPVASLVMLSHALKTPLSQLLEQFTPPGEPRPVGSEVGSPELLSLKTEYQRLQQKLEQQQQDLEQSFQQAALQVLEPWLLYWPTAAYKAKQDPQAPAIKILPLLRPLEQLLEAWGIRPIGAVGEETSYDPQQHQPMQGIIETNDVVQVRYVGYRRGDQLLYRAKVSRI